MSSVKRLSLIAALCFIFSPGVACGQEKPGDVMIDGYLAQETARISERFLDGARTLSEWEARRPRLKQEYFDMLGLRPLPERTPLHATVTGTLERPGVVIEKLHFQSRPGLYVTGNLYRPKDARGKLSAVLYVCGHSGRGRDGNKTAFQDHGLWFATNGYICLIIDTLQLGEIPGIHHGTYREGRWWWQALGYTPAGVECWNGIRALDYLVSRPDVDSDRLAVTGISGGGAATFWIAAADERVKCAVPVSGMSDLESYVTHKVINGHCDCMFLVNTYAWEWTTIAALVAPRPLLFANSDKDPIFPMDGNKRIIQRLRKLYTMYGQPDLVDEHVSPGGHDYRPDLRIAIFRWINRHLKGDSGPVSDTRFEMIPGKDLRVFPEDTDRPKDAINGRIDESFITRRRPPLPDPGRFDTWRQERIRELRRLVFRPLPERMPAMRGTDGFQTLPPDGSKWKNCYPTSEEWIRCHLTEPHPDGKLPNERAIVLLDTGEGTDSRLNTPWTKGLVDDANAYSFRTRGKNWMSGFDWTHQSPPNFVERAHALVGRTADSGRVWDVAAAVRYLSEEAGPNVRWTVVGRGPNGVIAAYAALFEPSIAAVVIVDPPVSHRDGPFFLNVLRLLDVPDALGLLAPRRLTLINARDAAFNRTEQIYRLAGAADKLQRN